MNPRDNRLHYIHASRDSVEISLNTLNNNKYYEKIAMKNSPFRQNEEEKKNTQKTRGSLTKDKPDNIISYLI